MSAKRRFSHDQDGQVLVVVGLAMVVLIAALALGLDWGFGLTQRRVMQNAADAGAVAAGRFAVKVVLGGPSGVHFGVTENQVFCTALDLVRLNEKSFGAINADPKTRPEDLRLQWADASKSPFHDLVAYSPYPPSPPGIDCSKTTKGSLDRNGGPTLDASARFIRVEAHTTFTALFGGSALAAAASATVSLHGATVPTSGPTWPVTRHYSRDIFDEVGSTPISFWSSNSPGVAYKNFKGTLDYSEFSTRLGDVITNPVPQLITDWDHSGIAPNGKVDQSGGNCGGLWDTHGDEDPQQHDKACSVPNWFYYQFQGVLSAETPRASVPTGQTLPADIGPRTTTVCSSTNLPIGLSPKSCVAPYRYGDWVETTGGDVANYTTQLLSFITQHPTGIDPVYGPYATMLVYLWDCAEAYTLKDGWKIVNGTADCSDPPKTRDLDRVHIFAVAPFTFYANLIRDARQGELKGFWGGIVSNEPGGGDLNEFANAVTLVD